MNGRLLTTTLNMYNPAPVTLNDDISDTITIVSSILSLSNNFKVSLTYIRNMQDKYETSSFELAAFRVLEIVLMLLKRYGYLFEKVPKKKVLENDYLRLVWSLILEALFPPEEGIRMIAAESLSKLSSEAKKDQYSNQKNSRGFEIYTRLVIDMDDDSKTLDAAVREMGNCPNDRKAITDEEKLMREGKEVVDGLARMIDGSNFLFQSYMLQFTGCSCVISKMNLGANGLYIATHVYSLDLPSCISDSSNINDIIKYSLTMNKVIEKNEEISTSGSFYREKTKRASGKLAWIREKHPSHIKRTAQLYRLSSDSLSFFFLT